MCHSEDGPNSRSLSEIQFRRGLQSELLRGARGGGVVVQLVSVGSHSCMLHAYWTKVTVLKVCGATAVIVHRD